MCLMSIPIRIRSTEIVHHKNTLTNNILLVIFLTQNTSMKYFINTFILFCIRKKRSSKSDTHKTTN